MPTPRPPYMLHGLYAHRMFCQRLRCPGCYCVRFFLRRAFVIFSSFFSCPFLPLFNCAAHIHAVGMSDDEDGIGDVFWDESVAGEMLPTKSPPLSLPRPSFPPLVCLLLAPNVVTPCKYFLGTHMYTRTYTHTRTRAYDAQERNNRNTLLPLNLSFACLSLCLYLALSLRRTVSASKCNPNSNNFVRATRVFQLRNDWTIRSRPRGGCRRT